MKISLVNYYVGASSTVVGKVYKDNVNGFCMRVKTADPEVLPTFFSLSDGSTFCLTKDSSLVYYPRAMLLPDGE